MITTIKRLIFLLVLIVLLPLLLIELSLRTALIPLAWVLTGNACYLLQKEFCFLNLISESYENLKPL